MYDDLSKTWGVVAVNGELKPAGEALVSAFDRGFLYGDGIYETVRVYSGEPFMLDAHLARMVKGCAAIGMDPPDMAEVKSTALRVLEANGLGEAYLRITVTRGATGRLWHDTASAESSVLVIAKPYTPPDFEEGLRLTVSTFRSDERSPVSGVKQIGILPKILARAEALRKGYKDALLLDTSGHVSEATSSNAFWVAGHELFTPSASCGILLGITRRVIMEIAREQEIPVREGEFPLEAASQAEELFLTSSTSEITPVRSLDGSEFQLGPMTRLLMNGYRARVTAWLGG